MDLHEAALVIDRLIEAEDPAYPRLPETSDARVKIPKAEHAVIKALHSGGESIRAIARSYGVDKRTIQFILFPERLAASRANRDWRLYHDKERQRKAIAAVRAKQMQVNHDKFVAYTKAAHKRNRKPSE